MMITYIKTKPTYGYRIKQSGLNIHTIMEREFMYIILLLPNHIYDLFHQYLIELKKMNRKYEILLFLGSLKKALSCNNRLLGE